MPAEAAQAAAATEPALAVPLAAAEAVAVVEDVDPNQLPTERYLELQAMAVERDEQAASIEAVRLSNRILEQQEAVEAEGMESVTLPPQPTQDKTQIK